MTSLYLYTYAYTHGCTHVITYTCRSTFFNWDVNDVFDFVTRRRKHTYTICDRFQRRSSSLFVFFSHHNFSRLFAVTVHPIPLYRALPCPFRIPKSGSAETRRNFGRPFGRFPLHRSHFWVNQAWAIPRKPLVKCPNHRNPCVVIGILVVSQISTVFSSFRRNSHWLSFTGTQIIFSAFYTLQHIYYLYNIRVYVIITVHSNPSRK